MNIVLIGAGSGSFGRGQLADLLGSDELTARDMTLWLVDTNEAALTKMTAVARQMAEHFGRNVALKATTDRREALPAADYVIVAVSVRRMELWEQDYRVPLSFGFKHVLGENGGPGAVFHALRSFELIIPICRDMEQLCPQAKLLNFTNPEARVLHAARTLTKVDAYGFCHGVFYAIDKLAGYLDRPAEQLDIVSAGMNHFFSILKCVDKQTGDNLLPTAVAKAAAEDGPHLQLFRHVARIYGIFLFPSDDHIGEYLSFGSEFHGLRWSYGLESRKLSPTDTPQPDALAEYVAGDRPADDAEVLRPSGESVVPIIADLEFGRDARHSAVNVLNDQGYIDNLPRDTVVEVPCRVSAGRIQPEHVGEIPRTLAAFMQPQCEILRLLTEAYRTQSKTLLLQALLLDPVVDSIVRAERMLDCMLELQSKFLPAMT
ncbi:MAG: family 4 glycosyl hydrolase [Planctomycetota bacterium]